MPFYALLGSVYQIHQVVFLLFDGHHNGIFDATKLPQFLVLPFNCASVRLSFSVFFILTFVGVKIKGVLETHCDANVFFCSFTPDFVPTSQAM